MVIALLAAAWAAPVVCDDVAAAGLLAEARIAEARAPVTHPELIPGLALASPRTDPELRAALGELCQHPERLSLSRAETWVGPAWSAHTFVLVQGEMRGCTLAERGIAITVGVQAGAGPRYRLRSRRPVSRTPVGECATVATWREEKVVDGADGPVRLVLVTDHEGDAVIASELDVLRAGPDGWTAQALIEPAPGRLRGGSDGAVVGLIGPPDDPWIVAHGDRSWSGGTCAPIGGQAVWTPGDSGWVRHEGREALGLLAERGAWRAAGQDAWLLIVAQEPEDDRARLDRRLVKLAPRVPDYDGDGHPDALHVLESSSFPGLNPGFLVATPDPWPDEAGARDGRAAWRPRRQAYVKRGWTAVDPCR